MPNFRLSSRVLILLIVTGLAYAVFLFRGSIYSSHDSVSPVLNFNTLIDKNCNSDIVLRVAIYPSGIFAPGIVANGGFITSKDSIYEKEEKIRMEFIQEEDPLRCLELLRNNNADLVWSNIPILSRYYAKFRSINPVAVMLCGLSSGEEIILSREPVKTFSTLSQKTIACVKWSAPHFLLIVLLRENGIDPDVFRWYYTLSDRDALALYEKRTAGIVALSGREKKETVDGHLIYSSSQSPALFPAVFIAREDVSITRKEHLLKFISGWFKGLDEIKKNRDMAIKELARHFNLSENNAAMLANTCVLAGLKENFEFFGLEKTTTISFDRSVELAKFYQNAKAENVPVGMLRSTELLAAFATKKKISSGQNPASSVFAETTLEKIILDTKISFQANDYSLDIDNAKRLEKFSEKALLFQNAKILLYGAAASKDMAVYNYAWGMRFYFVKKFLSDNGIAESRITIKEISNQPSENIHATDAVLCSLVP